MVIDESLLSGFLSALGTFSEELFKSASSHFAIDSGMNKITLFKGNNFIITIISNEAVLHLKDKILPLFEELEGLNINENEVQPPSVYEPFMVRIKNHGED